MRIHRREKQGGKSGFSLAELMVVIVIIGLLATMVVPNVLDRLKSANKGKARADLASLKSALDQYAIENGGRYPDTLEALITPDENNRTYLDRKKVPLDPWKSEYQFEPPMYSGTGELVLYSLGADKMPGGDGDDADIQWDAD